MKRDEFERNMAKLLTLLKKIIKSNPTDMPSGGDLSQLLGRKLDDSVVLNVCFFNFLPVTPEEMDELEQAYADAVSEGSEEGETEGAADFNWNQSDVDFLKRHGMRFS